jgi:hypothetical protein
MTDQDDATPAEARVRALLEPLRATGPEPPAELAPRLVRTVRWQRVVREALVATGAVATAVGDGLRAAIGLGRGSS